MIVATDWPEFASLDYARMRQVMRGRLLIDARSVVRPQPMRDLGFEFYSFTTPGDSNRSTPDGPPADGSSVPEMVHAL